MTLSCYRTSFINKEYVLKTYFWISFTFEKCTKYHLLSICFMLSAPPFQASLLLVTCLKIIESQIELNTLWPQSLAYFAIECCL